MTTRGEITYHGGGFVGLTGSVTFALAGWRVTIYDPDQATVDGINAGRPRAGGFLRYLDADVAALVTAGRLRATTQWDEVIWAPVHVVAVPTERDGEPYDGIVLAVLRDLLRDGPEPITILIESTLTPGTLDRLRAECVEDLKRNDVRRHLWGVGRAVTLAACPRRDWFPDRVKNLTNLHRVIGGVTPACTARALDIYATVTPRELLLPTDYRTAELTKAMENALLHVPVMLLHQLASALPEHNVAEAVRLVSTHWRFASIGPFYIGFGVGGRCVGLGTRYLLDATWGGSVSRAEGEDRLSIAGAAVDADIVMRENIARVVEANGCRTAAVLGIAYRPEFRDAGRSPGLGVARALLERGIAVHVADPMWPLASLIGVANDQDLRPAGQPQVKAFENPGLLRDFDAVLLATPHAVYLDWPTTEMFWRPGQLVLDGQGAWAKYRAQFTAMGVDYRQVGEAGWMRGKP